MSQVDEAKEREAMKKLAEAAAALAKFNNDRPLTKEQAEDLTKRST
jgi:hypothetical protein